MIVVYVDGLCEPVNPGGIATYGFIIKDETDGRTVARRSGLVGRGPEMSNNVAEYAALVEALQTLVTQGKTGEKIEVRGDSKLVINQMSGNWKFHQGLYGDKYRKAKVLTVQFPQISFKWVPREENEEADSLTREAYDRATGSSI